MKQTTDRNGGLWMVWGPLVALAVLLCAGGASAQSQGDLDAAREQFRLGNEAYQAERWQEAIQYFERANSIVPNVRLMLYIGQCYLAMDDPFRALEYIRTYANSSEAAYGEVVELLHALEQTQNLALERAQRAVDHAWRLARGGDDRDIASRAISDIRVVPIQIRSTPSGASVFVDDESLGPVGRTPLDTQLFVGVHHIIVRLDHYQPFVQRIAVAPLDGGPVPLVSAVLQRGQAEVDIRVNPITARVTYITDDGQTFNLGQGGFTGTLPAGRGVFLVQHAGQERRIEQAVMGTGDVERFTLNLNPADDIRPTEVQLGTLVVRSNLHHATISVDGAAMGEGIGEYERDLRPGPHTVRVSQEGYQTVTDLVNITSGERLTWVAPTRLEEVGGIPWGGIVTGALGAGAIVTGVVFGVAASDSETQFNDCQLDPACGYDEGDGYRGDAKTNALIADISFGVGAALAVTSVVLFLTAGPKEQASASAGLPFSVAAGPLAGGFGALLRFDSSIFSLQSW
ncbi:MAG: PEGA domain-containing protein [Bradymonadales bacterium]|nr:PEGA domain-containing protein [Bradymonadales bacterium]